MTRLTEEMVVARTRTSDIGCIRKLNCWGSGLSDVSLLRRMGSVEVLSLSVNKIASLSDFQWCRNLQELYVRRNDIRDLNQVCYLRDLPRLTSLWLDENPCAACELYRATVLRALPHLQKLDNVPVAPEEVQEALRRGRPLLHPEGAAGPGSGSPSPPPQRVEDCEEDSCYGDYDGAGRLAAVQRSPPRRAPPPSDPDPDLDPDPDPDPDPDSEPVAPPDGEPAYCDPDRRSASWEAEPAAAPGYGRRPPQFNGSYEDPGPEDGGPRRGPGSGGSDRSGPPRPTADDDAYSVRSGPAAAEDRPCAGYRQAPPLQLDGGRGPAANGPGLYQLHPGTTYLATLPHSQSYPPPQQQQPQPQPFSRRPVTRNSNILSAVLCLIKELDYPSLEVVEVAVRSRMEEF